MGGAPSQALFGQGEGFKDGLGLVHTFAVFLGGNGIGDDNRARLEVARTCSEAGSAAGSHGQCCSDRGFLSMGKAHGQSEDD